MTEQEKQFVAVVAVVFRAAMMAGGLVSGSPEDNAKNAVKNARILHDELAAQGCMPVELG